MAGYSSITLMTSPVNMLLSAGGAELANSRRFVDLWDIERARVQFNSSANISVRIEYSKDYGDTWSTLIDEDSYVGSNPYASTWFALPPEVQANDVLLRAVGIGSGLLLTVNYVELSFG